MGTLRIICQIVIFIVILYGCYAMFIDDEKSVGYASFLFSVILYIVQALIPGSANMADAGRSYSTTAESPSHATSASTTGEEGSASEILTDTRPETKPETRPEHITEPQTTPPVIPETEFESFYITEDLSGLSSYEDSLVWEGQVNYYTYTPDSSGIHYFWVSDTVPDVSVDVILLNDQQIQLDRGFNDITAELEAGEDYIIGISYRKSICDYTLNIEAAQPMTDLTGQTQFRDHITFPDQQNRYHYIAGVTGTYHFWISDMAPQTMVNLSALNSNGNEIKKSANDLTVDLEAGQQYTLIVGYRHTLCDYSLNVGVPNQIADITGQLELKDQIKYEDQTNCYWYTAPINGTYHFELTDRIPNTSVNLKILNSNQMEIEKSINKITIDLEAGQRYLLIASYKSRLCDYKLTIGVPHEALDITGLYEIGDSISYADQQNRYYYTASYTGSYLLEVIDIEPRTTVSVKVLNSHGNEVKKGVNKLTTNLEEGQTYQILVSYKSKPCDYILTIDFAD